MMLKIPVSPNYVKNNKGQNSNGDAYPCVVCGKFVKVPKHFVHLFWGSHAVTYDESLEIIAKEGIGGDMGAYPVGRCCLRQYPELKIYTDDFKAHQNLDIMPASGLRFSRRNQKTKTMISVYDGRLANMDTSAGRWQIVCEEHGTIASVETLKLARLQASDADFCEECRR